MKELSEKYYKNFAYINFDRNTRMEQLFSGDMNNGKRNIKKE